MTDLSPGQVEDKRNEPVAIVGIGCRFPGGIKNPEEFWQLLLDKRHAITTLPASRSRLTEEQDAEVLAKWRSGFLENIDLFDAPFFNISPREAERLDPQQRLLLEVAWEALEDAGQVPSDLMGSKTGVFVGLWLHDYEAQLFANPHHVDFYMTLGTGHYSASGRISYILGLQGPSVTIDTACSSSLVAVHLACQSLWNGESTVALAGGANLILRSPISIAYERSGMLAADNLCKFGDSRADGYVRSEGAAVLVLKPLVQAIVDQDFIYAVIQGGSINNDGNSSGYLATPGEQGQIALLRQAYAHAGIRPEQVQYVEAHGSGTKAGDPVELQALGAILAHGRAADQPCFVGSVKTNLGHTEGAAGIAGLIKVALALKKDIIPASLHLQELNPIIPWQKLKLSIPTESVAWPAYGDMVVAGVSSFGIAGTNAHMVLTKAPDTPAIQPSTSKENYLLPLSAHSAEALQAMVVAYRDYLAADTGADTAAALYPICYTASCRRSHHAERIAVIGQSKQEIVARLNEWLQTRAAASVSRPVKSGSPQDKIVFVFPGQGAQWMGMARTLFASELAFRESIFQCTEAMQPYVDWSLPQQLLTDEGEKGYRLDEIDVIQPALLSIEIALARQWQAWGIQPDAVIGHSMGEVAAAHVAGALTLKDAMCIICRRSQLLRQVSGQGAMALVELSMAEAEQAIRGYENELAVAVSNSPGATVLSGDPQALASVMSRLQAQEVYCRLIKVDVASHSPYMDALTADLSAALQTIAPRENKLPFYSTARGQLLNGTSLTAAYWVENLRQPVLFSKMVQQLLQDGCHTFIELSPHPILLPSIQQGFLHAGIDDGLALPSLRRDEPELLTLLESLGVLYAAGQTVCWANIYAAKGQPVKLPSYPWQRESFWLKPPVSVHTGQRNTSRYALLGQYIAAANGLHLWENEWSLEAFPYFNDHQVEGMVVVPAAVYNEVVLSAVREAFPHASMTLENVRLKEALILTAEQARTVQCVITPSLPGTFDFQFFSRLSGQSAETGAWTLHAQGVVHNQVTTREGMPSLKKPETLRARLPIAVTRTAHYRMMQTHGLHYGAQFQGISQLWHDQEGRQALARLQVPQRALIGMHEIHPTLLDAAFQLFITLFHQEDATAVTYLPVTMTRLQLLAPVNEQTAVWGYAWRQVGASTTFSGDVYLLDNEGNVLLAIEGLAFQPVISNKQTPIESWLYTCNWQVSSRPGSDPRATDKTGLWLIFAGAEGIGPKVIAELEKQGGTCLLISPGARYCRLDEKHYQLPPAHADDFHQLLRAIADAYPTPWRGVIHTWSMLAPPTEDLTPVSLLAAQTLGCMSVQHLLQALKAMPDEQPPRLWLVTCDAQVVGDQAAEMTDQSISIAQSPLWGLGGVISNEHPEFHCTRIDLTAMDTAVSAKLLMAELDLAVAEDQIAWRGEQRYVARLVPYRLRPAAADPAQTTRGAAAPGQGYRLVIPTPGVLDNLGLYENDRRLPGLGEVEIEVCAVGLNFIDILKSMGVYPGLPANAPIALGAECAGRVTAIGPEVTGVQVGDEIIAITPSFTATSLFSTYITMPVTFIMPKPRHLSWEQAATLPIAFLTAYYALHYLARLQPGERVLIHSASGGVGLAAVWLAQRMGAEIFATAGTAEKRAYLQELGIQHVMDSRSLSFATAVMVQTNQAGVDVVLNSLTDEAMLHSLSLLGSCGRFVEIGKQDIYQNRHLELSPFKKNLSYFAVDLARMVAERPAFIMSLVQEVMDLVAQEQRPPLPLQTFPVSRINEAFRLMAQARHIGKIAISLPDEAALIYRRGENQLAAAVSASGTYLITGGLGALGLVTASWLVEQGARHLVLLGRNGANAQVEPVLERLREQGARLRIASADVTQTDPLAALLAEVSETMPPLKGIVHAAGILQDNLILQLNEAQFERVLAPKLLGAWNLHCLTRHLSLDFFILYSSAASLLHLPGQANYVAANAFLDALAHYRRLQGLPGLSINWGPWADIGLAATDNHRGARLAAQGLGSLTAEQGKAALTLLLSQTSAQIGVMPFDYQQWHRTAIAGRQVPFFTELRSEAGGVEPQNTVPANDWRRQLLDARPGPERRLLLESHLREEVGQVLRLAAAKVPLDKPLKDLGLDSLMALELRNRIETSLQLRLSTTFVFNYPTIKTLVPHLSEKMGIPLDAVVIPEQPSSKRSPLASENTFDALSTSDLETLLTEELAQIDGLLRGS